MLKLFNKGRIRGPVGFYQEKHTACNRKALQNDPKNVGKSQKILFEVSVTVSCFKITSELLKTTKWVEKPTKFQRIFFMQRISTFLKFLVVIMLETTIELVFQYACLKTYLQTFVGNCIKLTAKRRKW